MYYLLQRTKYFPKIIIAARLSVHSEVICIVNFSFGTNHQRP